MNPSKEILCWMFIKEKEQFVGEVVKEAVVINRHSTGIVGIVMTT